MGWTTTNWQDTDFTDIRYINDLYAAGNERLGMIGGSPLTAPAIGDDATALGAWTTLQETAIGIAAQCVQSANTDGSARAPDYYNDTSTAMDMWEDSDDLNHSIWRAAGLYRRSDDGYGFRRAATPPADWTDINDPAYAFGRAQDGDIIGPWIPQDICNVLRLLVWTRPPAALSSWTLTEYLGYGTNAVWATALADAQSSWTPTEIGGSAPYAYCEAYVGNPQPNWGTNFTCIAARGSGTIMLAAPDSALTADVDFQVQACAQSAWDDEGDTVVQDQYRTWSTVAKAAHATSVTSGALGGTAFPNLPSPVPPVTTSESGWNMADYGPDGASRALIRWSGFQYP